MTRKNPSRDLAVLDGLSTANLADALLRLGLPLRVAPPGVAPLQKDACATGPARPVKHAGSVDVFLEALEASAPGDILVIDNQGRSDEGAIGDLIAGEARLAGLTGIVLWGAHRDTGDILEIGLPVWSLGAFPAGPVRLDPRSERALDEALIGDVIVTAGDVVAADGDGVVFIPARHQLAVAATARRIRDLETRQSKTMKRGRTLRSQLHFDTYLERRDGEPALTFRRFLQEVEGAIET